MIMQDDAEHSNVHKFVAMRNLKQSWLIKWFVGFPSGMDCTQPTQMSTACDHNGSFMMHHHDHSAWSQWLTMTPYGPSDLSWSYWSYDYSSSFHVHLRPLYHHHPNDHHSLGCISLKRRPAVEGWHDDMLPTAPVLEPLLNGHSFQQSSSLNVNPLHGPFQWKNNSIYSLTCSTCFEMFVWCVFCAEACAFLCRGGWPPQPFWSDKIV